MFNLLRKFFSNINAIIIAGLILRLVFILFGAKIYFGRENIFVDGDTWAWLTCMQNLFDHGTYTLDASHEYGYFVRTPGYGFFMGIFYFISGKNWDLAFPIIGWVQVFLDTISIWFIYQIALQLFNRQHKIAVVPAILYAFYPFAITWTPVVYSETSSLFFMLWGLYVLFCSKRNSKYFLSAALLSFSALTRPQLLPLLPFIMLYIFFSHDELKKRIQYMFLFGLGFLLIYGPWPLRNYINHQKVVITQDLRGLPNADEDWIAFTQYIYSVKTEFQPQFDQIIHNQNVDIPAIAFTDTEDSLKLIQVIDMAKNCASSFSHWSGYWNKPFKEPNCNQEVKSLFDELRTKQIQANPFHYYVTLPLLNLKKALFKYKLNDTSTMAKKIASLLFIGRTLLILLGIIGLYLMIRNKMALAEMYLILFYFLFIYLALCFGTGPQFRNIEIRYFLQVDVLLLLPAGYAISYFINKPKLV